MNLRTYLDSLPRGGAKNFAGRIGVEPVYLSQLAAKQGGRQPSPALCVVIEQATDGVVSRTDLRDDWKAIWPELKAEA